jgi:hypothetical protein
MPIEDGWRRACAPAAGPADPGGSLSAVVCSAVWAWQTGVRDHRGRRDALLEVCPSFRDTWRRIEVENGPGDDSPTRLHYVDAGEFSAHLVDLHQKGQTGEVIEAFSALERLHVEGDHYVRELATIGYLEGIQNVASNNGVDPSSFERYLAPESRRWWNGLNAFWAGGVPTVQAGDDPP